MYSFLLPALAFVTMGLVVAFALWGKKRIEDRKADDRAPTSSLARATPDPQFVPDRDITDPHRVADGDPAPGRA